VTAGDRAAGRIEGVYLVTDTQLCGRRGVVETARAAVAGGVRIVQVREKSANTAELYELVLRIAEAVGHAATVVVDDRVDVFLAARAAGAAVHGVHTGQSDLPVERVRALVGAGAVVGLTANTPEHLDTVHRLPGGTVDYLGVGVIRPTSTKPDHPAPLGINGFGRIAAATTLPCIAIGGIEPGDIVPLRRAGAAGIAVVSAICAADHPTRSAEDLAARWDSGGSSPA
jgi:thiamine-phosphate pyrophosphorylase